MEKPRITDV